MKKTCIVCKHNEVRRMICLDCKVKYLSRSLEKGGFLQGMDITRELVRIRDKHTCQLCGKEWEQGQRRFDIHHLNGCGKKSRRYDKISETKDLITYCHRCHLNLESVKRRMSQRTSPRPRRDKSYYYKNYRQIYKRRREWEARNKDLLSTT